MTERDCMRMLFKQAISHCNKGLYRLKADKPLKEVALEADFARHLLRDVISVYKARREK